MSYCGPEMLESQEPLHLSAAGAGVPAAPGAGRRPAALRLPAEAACPEGVEAAARPVPPQVHGAGRQRRVGAGSPGARQDSGSVVSHPPTPTRNHTEERAVSSAGMTMGNNEQDADF